MVVKMRKEVKKARVLTIRRLTRHIAKLKLKKGSEDVVLKNQRRAERLLEEIHAMKEMKPDQVTKLALGGEINFEQVCKKPNSTAADRATARLATHPLLKTKIADIKAAVKAFKDARQKPPKTQSLYEHKSEEQHSQKPKLRQHSNSNLDNQTHTLVLKQQEAKTKMNVKTATNIENKQICESECEQKSSETERTDSLGDLSLQTSEEHAIVQDQTETTIDWPKRKKLTSANRFGITNKSKSDVSDMEEFDNKEYFDDSTEERFYNQSSDSEDSDSDDDFFIGKVKKKKKKVAHSDLSSAKEKKRLEALLNKTKDSKSMTMQNVLTEESKPSAKAMKLESVFCNSLSRSDQKSKNMKRNVNYQTSKNRRTAFPKNELRVKRTHLAKAAGVKYENKKKHLEQPLHPSWEASKKRREQISQITAFQGKKIKFDD
ncbi:serum response factor-binding protein 1 isoform X2 [Mauremys reevesii]|uniref:serum response factor-binding protein 1 isoform X2 n=1 Tax=Mauremys reevesii TaxID=260615 RepID=UPI00193FD9A9|nr:serum response factor-binding protein 1 isoform X2 [Mauremys reevesii]